MTMPGRGKFPTYQQEGPLGIFKDGEHDESFRSAGFVKVRFFDADEAAALLREATPIMSAANSHGKFESAIDLTSVFAEPDQKRRVHDWIMERIADRCLAFFNDYKIAQAGLSNKPAGSGVLATHMAWTLMEDPNTVGVTAWIALEDVDIPKGAMKLLKGGHGLGLPAWGPSLPLRFYEFFRFLDPDLTTCPVKAGEGLIFDSYLPHGSTANTTDQDRLAVRIQMIPEEAENVLHGPLLEDPTQIAIYPSGATHLATLSHEQLYGNDMMVEPIATYSREELYLTKEEFLEAIRQGDSIRSGKRDLASFVTEPAPPPPKSVLQRLRGRAGSMKRRLLQRAGLRGQSAAY